MSEVILCSIYALSFADSFILNSFVILNKPYLKIGRIEIERIWTIDPFRVD